MGPVVTFAHVWKKFQRGERHTSLRDLVPGLARRALRRGRARLAPTEFWALSDVTFDVQPGRALGIIGPNGAGKSTTLKLLTRILRPTSGACAVNGRFGALIEVAAGFHPELTGRENIFFQGLIMGMRRRDIARKLEEIVEFSGVRDFIDTPVKRYSSGMNARLGFSVAAHLDPDVMLIDEVLAVGDMAFQEKCFERMRAYKAAGVAIVFVSHNLSAVSALCDEVLVLRGGRVQMLGPAPDALAAYATVLQEPGAAASTGETVIELRDASGRNADTVCAGAPMVFRAVVATREAEHCFGSVIRIRRLETGEVVFQSSTESVGCQPIAAQPGDTVDVRWHLTANLARGHYSVEFIAFNARTRRLIASANPAALFTVRESVSERGLAHLEPQCTMRLGRTSAQPQVVH